MITQNNISDLEELAIYQLIEDREFSSVEDFLDKDPKKWTGIEVGYWVKEKGKKTERVFTYLGEDEEGNEVIIQAIKSVYRYVLAPNNWGIVSYERFIQYLKHDGSVGLEKKIKAEASYGKITRLNREIKLGVIDELREKGKNLETLSTTLPEPYKSFYVRIANATDTLLKHYYDLIHKDCIDFTWDPWVNALMTETDQSIVDELNVPANEDGSLVVKQIILSYIV